MNAPHDRPTVGELVEAVREFLEGEVLPQASGRVGFHARVAINALGIVERELTLGPELATAHGRRLAQLGFESEAELAEAIRRGELDERLSEVRAAVLATVRDKLRVANPDHLLDEATSWRAPRDTSRDAGDA